MRRRNASLALLAALLVAQGCTYNYAHLQQPGRAVAFPTAWPWNSMVYAARTDSGLVVIDLGWRGASGKLERRLRRLGATPRDVTDVFLTHSHRDHIGAWRAVRRARFHVYTPEVPELEGREPHADIPSRAAAAVLGNPAPWPGELEVEPFTRDTAFIFGNDTLRAYPVPGHTAGSAAYLFRGVLFLGDAIARNVFLGFHSGNVLFTRDGRQNKASVRALFARIDPQRVRWICSAHAKCAPASDAVVHKLTDRR